MIQVDWSSKYCNITSIQTIGSSRFDEDIEQNG